MSKRNTKAIAMVSLTKIVVVLAITIVAFFMLMPTKVFAETEITVSTSGDITKNIQAALDQAKVEATERSPFIITIPPGTYSLTGQLKIYSNTHIKMPGVTIIRGNMSPKTMIKVGFKEKFYGYNGHHNITIEGGTISGNNCKTKIFEAVHARNITLKNVTFKDVTDSHHVEIAATKDITVENCTFSGYTGAESGGANVEALQFETLSEGHFAESVGSYFDDTPCENIVVKGCTFKNLRNGVGTHTAIAGSYFNNVVIEDNTFSNIIYNAISAMNYQNCKITGNKITNAGSGIWARTMTYSHTNVYRPKKEEKLNPNANILIENNTINVENNAAMKSITTFGISVYGENLKKDIKVTQGNKTILVKKGDYRIKNVTVRNNNIVLKNRGYGLWIRGVMGSTFQNNSVKVSIPSNATGNGNGDCVRIDASSSIKLNDNTLSNTTKNSKSTNMNGISVLGGSKSIGIEGNSISKVRKAGIHVVDSSTVTAKKNTIKSSAVYGLFVAEKSTLSATDNKITKSGHNAMLQANSGKLKGADYTGNKITSFKINGVSGKIKGKTITVTLPKGTKLTSLKPVIKTNTFAKVSPGSKKKMNFKKAVKYKVTSYNGESVTYKVIVKVSKK